VNTTLFGDSDDFEFRRSNLCCDAACGENKESGGQEEAAKNAMLFKGHESGSLPVAYAVHR
jgi:hypothetical protein